MTAYTHFVHNINTLATTEDESQELVHVLQKLLLQTGTLLRIPDCALALLDASRTIIARTIQHQYGQEFPSIRVLQDEGAMSWVRKHHEPFVINRAALTLQNVPGSSIIYVPLLYNESFHGTLVASSREIESFGADEVRILTIFAEQAALIIAKARQAELAQQRARRLEMLMHLSRGMTMRLEQDALYRLVLADVRYLVDCDRAMIYLPRGETQELVPVAEWSRKNMSVAHEPGPERAGIKIIDRQREKIKQPDTEAIIVWAATHRHAMVYTPPATACAATAMNNMAQLATPFVSRETLYGVLSLWRETPFTGEELRIVRNLSHLVATALENTELFQRVRSDQEQLRAILAASSDGIAMLDNEGRFIEANAAFGQLFHIASAQLPGLEGLKLFVSSEDDVAEQGPTLVRRALETQQPLAYSEIELQIQGRPRALGLSITPVAVGKQPISLLIARDVTAIRDATRMKANFLSMITHELRSPLNAINGYLDLALTGLGGELSEQQREFILRARAGSEHLYALVEDLLLLSRADSGQLRLNREIIKLQDVIANAREEMELTAADQDINLAIEIADDFPRLYADGVRLQQVLRNLLSNALRFTPAKGTVVIAANLARLGPGETEIIAEDGRVVELQVRDTGSGIPRDFHQRIFERFFQVPDGSSGRASGQGLGLAIVKMIVELHGGRVSVESEPEEGSTFTCILPCLLA
ncbi:ATP-binding protein [Ktedonosporobacter rubrisoli]|nr:ATP-binding protein [Ktedonosporobacter rubrisoli]